MAELSGKGIKEYRPVYVGRQDTYCSSTWFRENDIGNWTDSQDEWKSTDFSSVHYDPGAVDRKDWGSFFMWGRAGGRFSFTEFKTAKGNHGCNLSGIAQCHDKISGNAGRCRWGEWHRHRRVPDRKRDRGSRLQRFWSGCGDERGRDRSALSGWMPPSAKWMVESVRRIQKTGG